MHLQTIPVVPENLPTWFTILIVSLWAINAFVWPITKGIGKGTKIEIAECQKQLLEKDERIKDKAEQIKGLLAENKEQGHRLAEIEGYIKGVKLLLKEYGIEI